MATPKKRLNIELLLSLSATFLSLAALVVSVFQTKIAREQQQASVWPYVQAGGSHSEDDFEFNVVNNGVGPAIIKKVSCTYKNVFYPNHIELLETVANKYLTDSVNRSGGHFYESLSLGDVIKAGDEVNLYFVKHNERKAALFAETVHDSSFHMRIVFSDVYGNCWQVDQNKVTPLTNCDESSKLRP